MIPILACDGTGGAPAALVAPAVAAVAGRSATRGSVLAELTIR